MSDDIKGMGILDIDTESKELLIIGVAIAGAAAATILDGVSADQLIMVIMTCLAYGFGKFNQGGGSVASPDKNAKIA